MKILPKPYDLTPEAGTQSGLPGLAKDIDYIPKGKGLNTQIKMDDYLKLLALQADTAEGKERRENGKKDSVNPGIL